MLTIETNFRITAEDFQDIVVSQSQADDGTMLFTISQDGIDIELSLEMMNDLAKVLERLNPPSTPNSTYKPGTTR